MRMIDNDFKRILLLYLDFSILDERIWRLLVFMEH
jgi:hypothetical protein